MTEIVSCCLTFFPKLLAKEFSLQGNMVKEYSAILRFLIHPSVKTAPSPTPPPHTHTQTLILSRFYTVRRTNQLPNTSLWKNPMYNALLSALQYWQTSSGLEPFLRFLCNIRSACRKTMLYWRWQICDTEMKHNQPLGTHLPVRVITIIDRQMLFLWGVNDYYENTRKNIVYP